VQDNVHQAAASSRIVQGFGRQQELHNALSNQIDRRLLH
jgi:hypothetical protein